MLRVTDNKYIGLYANDVKRLLLTTVVEMGDYPIEGLMCVYDDFLLIDRMRQGRGDVVLWVTNGIRTRMYVGRVMSDMAKEGIRSMSENSEIKIFRIERMTADFDVVELKINH